MKKMLIVLTLVMALSGLVLAGTFAALTERIEINRERALQASLAALFAGADEPSFDQLDVADPTIYRGTDGAGDLLGYAVRVVASGYNGPISMLVGLTPELDEIVGLQVVENIETPGLGGRITEAGFRSQFAGLDPTRALRSVRNIEPDPSANQVQAISSATITTEAVVAGINQKTPDAIEAIRRAER
ncbi:MAG: FMN-binding protein [Spirochaetaceae bacterium]|nr:MAG: FMN-binding protein [Spirochaetaceae bacterium]